METRFRLKQGEFEVEVAGDRDFVESMLAMHGDRWLRMASGLDTASDTHTMIRVNSALPIDSTKSAPRKRGDTKAEDFPRVRPDFRPQVNVDLSDFVAMKSAVAPLDLFVVGVYYMERYLQRDTFEIAELQGLLGELPAWECRRAEDMVDEALIAGFVERLRDGRYSITFKGQNYVRDGLAT